ncbi:hypothetical protein CBW55_22235 [Yersinia intermedia]|nr:hypothetical protein CBW55_22235 [Yersinia intermedia]
MEVIACFTGPILAARKDEKWCSNVEIHSEDCEPENEARLRSGFFYAVNPYAMPGVNQSIESYRNKPWRNAGLGR